MTVSLKSVQEISDISKIAKYFVVGGICFLIDFAIFYILTKQLGYNYLPVNAISFSIATISNYLLCIVFVFESGLKYKKRVELPLVFLVSSFSLAINQVLLFAFVELLCVELLISKAIAVILTFLLNYFGRSKLVFGKSG